MDAGHLMDGFYFSQDVLAINNNDEKNHKLEYFFYLNSDSEHRR